MLLRILESNYLTFFLLQHVALMAAAISGFVVVDVNQDDIKTVEDLRSFLRLAKCKLIYFEKTTDDLNCIELLRKAIPEFYYCKCFCTLYFDIFLKK